jgi:hypothetical protein
MARMSQSRNAILTMTLVTQNAIANTTFDGTWFVTVNAHQYENPDGSAPLAASSFAILRENRFNT